MIRRILMMFAALAVSGLASTALADDAIVAFVTEETADATGSQQSFWWQSGTAPTWSATDAALRDALRASGAGFAEPTDVSMLSKIYRRPLPSDANAVAMASVFGRRRALVGTVRYAPTSLRPVGLVGWHATVSLRLVEPSNGGPSVLRTVEFERFRWAQSDDEAREALRLEVSRGVATSVAAGFERQVGPVGIDSDELLIGISGPTSRAAIDAVRAKLESFAGVTAARERWAAEGIVVLEVNPGAADPRESVQQYASLLSTEGAGQWRVVTSESKWPNVVVFRLEEQAR